MVCRDDKIYYSAGRVFLLIITRSGRRADIRWSICISKSQRNESISFSRILAQFPLSSILAQFPLDHLPYQVMSSLRLFFVLICNIRLLYDWSSLSPHNLHLRFCCLIYFCFNIVRPHGIVLCCSEKRFSFSLILSHVQVFSCDISLICSLKYPYSCFSPHFCFLVIVLWILVLYSWERQQRWCIKIFCFFSFSRITRNVRMGSVRESRGRPKYTGTRATVWFFCETYLPFCFVLYFHETGTGPHQGIIHLSFSSLLYFGQRPDV